MTEKSERLAPEQLIASLPADEAIAGLVDIGRAAVPALIDALGHPEPVVCGAAAVALGRIGNKNATEPLEMLAALPAGRRQKESPQPPEVRRRAITALGWIGDPMAVPALTTLLTQDPDPALRGTAIRALGRMRHREALATLLALVPRAEPDRHADLVQALRQYDEPEANAAVTALLRAEGNAQPGTPGTVDDPGLTDPLLVDLATDSALARQKAADRLGQSGDPRAVTPLLDLLENERDRYVRVEAIESLGQIGDAAAVAPLLNALPEERDDNLRAAILLALARIAGVNVIDSLWSLLDKPYLRGHIIGLLGDLADKRAAEPLLDLLNREMARADGGNGELMEALATALAKIGDPRAVEPLLALLERDHVRPGPVVEALGRTGDPRALPPIVALMQQRPDIMTRGAARRAIPQLADPTQLEALLPLLHITEIPVKLDTIELLGKIGDPRAVEPLIGLLHDPGDVSMEREILNATATALAAIGDPRAVEPLRKVRRTPEIKAAIKALKQRR